MEININAKFKLLKGQGFYVVIINHYIYLAKFSIYVLSMSV